MKNPARPSRAPENANIFTCPFDSRGDGLTYREAFEQKLNPNDFFNGQAPVLSIIGGNNQFGKPESFLSAPLVVSVRDNGSQPLANAPVTFTVSQGEGSLWRTNLVNLGASTTILTDANGEAKVYFRLPVSSGETSQITASAGTASVVFTEHNNGGGSYSDPFDPTNVVATMNADGSIDVSWTNRTDPNDTEPINIRYRNKEGAWVVAVSDLPPGTTSWHIPAE